MWMLLHGFMGSPRSWERAISAGDADAPLVPFLMGHGADWKNTRVASFGEEVTRLLALASTMAAPRYLGGYSMGARVALGMLAARSELFEGAVLIGVHPGLEEAEARTERRATDAARALALRTGGLCAFVDAWANQPLFASQRGMPAEVLDAQREVRLSHDPDGLASSLEVLGLAAMPDYGPVFRSLKLPVALVAGEWDAKFTTIARGLSSDMHRSHVVDAVGHNVLLEAPEVVAQVLETVEKHAHG